MSSHNDSKSHTQLTATAHGMGFASRVQSLSLIEEIPELDLDGDGLLSAAECLAGDDVIVDCLAHGFLFGKPGSLAPPVGDCRVEVLPRTADGFGMPELQLVLVEWQAQWPADLELGGPVSLANRLFEKTSPGHQDVLTHRFATQEARIGKWTAGAPTKALFLETRAAPTFLPVVWRATWQQGSGLGLLLVLLYWLHGREGSAWIRSVGRGCFCFLLAAFTMFFWLPHVPRIGPMGTWLLPAALLYMLADAKLGGGLLRSPFAMLLWGASFSIAMSSGALPYLDSSPPWYVLAVACLAPFAAAVALRPLTAQMSGKWSARLAWGGVGVAFLLRAIERFT